MNGTGIRSYPASRAFEWLAEGWRIFKLAPRTWLLAAVVTAAIVLLLSMVPKLGELLANFASLLLFGGLLLMAQDLDAGGNPPVSRLFAAFQTRLAPVLLTSIIIGLLLGIVIFGVVILAGGSAMLGKLAGGGSAKALSYSTAGFLLLAGLVVALLAIATSWFAPGLVVLQSARPMDAIQQSFRGSMRNWTAVLLLSVLFFGLAIAATIPFGLGWLVLMPVLAGASYASIKDVFPPG